ncbi:Ion-translocating oxidoreductase complex subunit B [subsurface metagenome]
MVSEDTIYHELQKKIHESTPVGFPASKDGIEIQLLKMLLSPEETKIATHLGALPEPLETILRRINKSDISISLIELEEILDRLVENGVIMGGAMLYDREKKIKRYSLTQWAVGIFEYQLGRMTKEFAELANKYNLETFYKEMHRKDRPTQLHTVPVEKSLTPEHHASTYDNIRDIIMNKVDAISLRDCVCREEHDLLEEPCKLSDVRHCCVMFNDFARGAIASGSGKEVSKEEFFDILDTYQKEGFVLHPQNSKNPMYMCVCCGCCCGLLNMAKQFPRPAEYYFSNFYAQSDPELCNGCEICQERCQMDAITMVDDRSTVNLDRCIGCGNCVATCETDAMVLHKRGREKVPPENMGDLYQKIIEKKITYVE